MSTPDKPNVHVYDDIVEEDNHLPNWWLATLYGAIVFAFGYWMVFHSAKLLPNPPEAWRLEQEEAKRLHPEGAAPSGAMLAGLAKDQAKMGEAEKIFKGQCVACHGPNGEGLVGPNLTDKFWIHGSKPEEIYKSVSKGYLDKGMPSWEPVLGQGRVKLLAAYVYSIKGKNLPGKAPQGVEEP